MTNEELDRLDRLAAEKVLCWPESNFSMATKIGGRRDGSDVINQWTQKAFTDGKRVVMMTSGATYPYNVDRWQPTRNIAQAFEVLMEMKDWHPTISYCDTTMSWSCYFTKTSVPYTCIEDTAPLAIVKAVLKAKNLI